MVDRKRQLSDLLPAATDSIPSVEEPAKVDDELRYLSHLRHSVLDSLQETHQQTEDEALSRVKHRITRLGLLEAPETLAIYAHRLGTEFSARVVYEDIWMQDIVRDRWELRPIHYNPDYLRPIVNGVMPINQLGQDCTSLIENKWRSHDLALCLTLPISDNRHLQCIDAGRDIVIVSRMAVLKEETLPTGSPIHPDYKGLGYPTKTEAHRSIHVPSQLLHQPDTQGKKGRFAKRKAAKVAEKRQEAKQQFQTALAEMLPHEVRQQILST